MLNNKVVVVTGGAGLLGQTFIISILENNGIAIIADNDENRGLQTEHELKQRYGESKIYFNKLDITSHDSIVNLVDILIFKYGRIDALVNNAYPRNINYGKQFFDVTYADFCENVNMHLGGYFLTTQIFAKYFVEQQKGNIINIASIYGVIAPKFEIYRDTNMTTPVEYAVVKSAIIQFTKYLAKYLKGENIRVNSISPGGIFNNQPEQFIKKYNSYSLSKGMLDKKDVTGTLIFLLSDESKYINGQNIVIDDGFSI